MNDPICHDALYRLAQVGEEWGIRLVRLVERVSQNRYRAEALEFAAGQLAVTDEPQLTVLNLAEPADTPGTLPAGTDAVALDAEGKWIIFVRPASGTAPEAPASAIIARVIAPTGGAGYTVRPQDVNSQGQWIDKAGASNLTASNLAELSLGPGGAVDVDQRVVVWAIDDLQTPPQVRYVFDHPAYAKYLD